MVDIKKVNGHILDMMIYHWDYEYGEIKMEDINKYNESWKAKNGEPMFDEEQIKHIEENLAGWHMDTGHEGYHNHDGQVCDYYIHLSKDGKEYSYWEEHSLVTGWFLDGDNDGNVDFHYNEPATPTRVVIAHDDTPEDSLSNIESVLKSLGVSYKTQEVDSTVVVEYYTED